MPLSLLSLPSQMMRAFASPILRRTAQRSFHSTPAALDKLNIEGLASKVDLSGQNVLMRVDLNVPLDKSDEVTVTDDTRLRAIVPSAKVSRATLSSPSHPCLL